MDSQLSAVAEAGNDQADSLEKTRRPYPTEDSSCTLPSHHAQCVHCQRDMRESERALFVEEELGRVYCSQACIINYFSPEVQRIDWQYRSMVYFNHALPESEEMVSQFRGRTLACPDEVWLQIQKNGELRYAFISEHGSIEHETLWCICICLCLRGEPSFLFKAMITESPAILEFYRQGERIVNPLAFSSSSALRHHGEETFVDDRLAQEWTLAETKRASRLGEWGPADIAEADQHLYSHCVDETLKHPDELWCIVDDHQSNSGSDRTFHFIRHYDQAPEQYWFIIVARELKASRQIEIVDVFPTNSARLAEGYRIGRREPMSSPRSASFLMQ